MRFILTYDRVGYAALANALTDAFLRTALIAGLLFCVLSQDASAMPITKRVHGDSGDFIIACDAGPFTADYAAETASGVPLTSAYAIERGADKGLVRLMAEGGKRVTKYKIPRGLIRAIVRVKLDADIPDRADLVFTTKGLTLVHTSTADGGIFTDSDVYQLAYSRDGGVDDGPLRNRDLHDMLHLGLSVYDTHQARCSLRTRNSGQRHNRAHLK